jgi:sulfatase maturation enzyme AslB (radical SAM superfamily)
MTWQCAAIDHGITIFPHGKIGPCCQISSNYLKPIESLADPMRFADLKTQEPPKACEACSRNESNNVPSYRTMFNNIVTAGKGIQFVVIRHSNLCNLKCRYCGPHFSSQWVVELKLPAPQEVDLMALKGQLLTDDLHWMYFTGGEPLINSVHWALLQELIDSGKSSRISLMYNTNLTTIKYKNINIIDLWKKFKSVKIQCSIDAIGEPLEYIRSGAEWVDIENNLQQLIARANQTNIEVTLSPVISILNLWFLPELLSYAEKNNLSIDPIVLSGPDYLALDVIPDELKTLALDKISESAKWLKKPLVEYLQQLVNNNINQCLFTHTLSHVLLLDNNRNEHLFKLLPFNNLSRDIILKNHEYK